MRNLAAEIIEEECVEVIITQASINAEGGSSGSIEKIADLSRTDVVVNSRENHLLPIRWPSNPLPGDNLLLASTTGMRDTAMALPTAHSSAEAPKTPPIREVRRHAERKAKRQSLNNRARVVQALNSTQSVRRKTQTDRTTRMLIAVLVLFLASEIPHGVLSLLSSILGRHFFTYCHNGISEFLDLLSLINSSINFVLYCSMSRQFRTKFKQIFGIKCKENCDNELLRRDSQLKKPISPSNQSKLTNI